MLAHLSAHKVDSGEENSPADLAGIRTRNLSITSPALEPGSVVWFYVALTSKLSWLLFGVRSTPVLPQWYLKDPGHSAKSAGGGRLPLNTYTPLTQRSRSRLTMPLSRHSVGTYPETSSQATRVREHSVTVVSAR